MFMVDIVEEPTASALPVPQAAKTASETAPASPAVPETTAPVPTLATPEAPATVSVESLAARLDALAERLVPKVEDKEPEVPAMISIDPLDFVANPTEALDKFMQNKREIDVAIQRKQEFHAKKATDSLVKEHPDAEEVFKSSAFNEWVVSNKGAKAVLDAGLKAFDASSVATVVGLYKAQKSMSPAAAAKVAEAISAVPQASSSETKPRFTRGQLQRMSQSEAEARDGEIREAYALGLVSE